MDRNFHTDDFERLLREKSDEFRMYPSKRIWHSIYNNIHPGRKWPSVAMSTMLIAGLFLIGYLNTKNPNLYPESGKNMVQQKTIAQTKSSRFIAQPIIANAPNLENETLPDIVNNSAIVNKNTEVRSNDNLNSGIKNKVIPSSSPANSTATGQPAISADMDISNGFVNINNLPKETIPVKLLTVLENVKIETAIDDKTAAGDDQYGVLTIAQKISINDILANLYIDESGLQNVARKIPGIIQGGNSAVEKNDLAANKKSFISAEDRAWIENYALYNRPATKKWANKLAWQTWATPSVVFRTLYNDPNFGNTLNPAPFAISASNLDINKAVNHKPSIGFEMGTGLQYLISKRITLKAGLQLNYTRYNSEAFQNTHPMATRLTMHDYNTNTSYEEIRTTPYSNKTGLEAVKLHNQTFQLSLPIGADVKLIGNENIQWNFGVTIQPTYVPAGRSYLISFDRRNYVQETSMLNRWNLNAGIETFISYKGSNGLIFQLGPQFRTQLFSTNSKQIAVEERLLNYGLKLGVSKTLK